MRYKDHQTQELTHLSVHPCLASFPILSFTIQSHLFSTRLAAADILKHTIHTRDTNGVTLFFSHPSLYIFPGSCLGSPSINTSLEGRKHFLARSFIPGPHVSGQYLGQRSIKLLGFDTLKFQL